MPPVSSFRRSPPFNQLFAELSRFLTPRRYRKNERWVAALPDYIDVHRSIAKILYEYLDQPRRNYARPRGTWIGSMAPSQAFLGSASNMEARVAFAQIALQQLRAPDDLYREPLHFVTVSPRTFISPRETASQVNFRSLQKLTGQALAGLSFIGMVDFALFKSWGAKGIRELDNHVGVHTHNLVFGATREEIKQGLLNAGLLFGGWTGGAAYDILPITAEKLEGYLLYMLKAPLFEYHARKGVRLFRNRLTGETECHSRFPAYKLRTGDQFRMAAILHDMYLQELLFGQGRGTELVRAVRHESLEPLRHANEIARRQGRSAIPLTIDIKPEDRPLLSACVREPFSLLKLLRRWKRAKPVGTQISNGEHIATNREQRGSARQAHDPELDNLDG